MKLGTTAVLLLVAFPLSGCGLMPPGFPLAANLFSLMTTNRGLGSHGLSVVSGRDCRILEGAFSAERDICEDWPVRTELATRPSPDRVHVTRITPGEPWTEAARLPLRSGGWEGDEAHKATGQE